MAISAPVILLPTNIDYATDIDTQVLSGTTDINTKEIRVNNSLFGVSYTTGDENWAWSGKIAMGVNTINIVAIEQETLIPSATTTINITLIQSTEVTTVSPPTGVKLRRYKDAVEILNTQNPEPTVQGYNYYVSTESGGIDNVYVKMNTIPVQDPTSSEVESKLLSRTTETVGNIRTTKITEEVKTVNYYSFVFTQNIYNNMVTLGLLPEIAFNNEARFYFVITAMIYDPVQGLVTESAYSIELEGAPVTITTGLKTLPARTQNDIILTLSQEMLTSNKGIDTKPATVIRDIVDPISEEMARIYVIQDFMDRSLSISSLLDFDDANGDGISDDVSTSTPKKALQIALNISDPVKVQDLIDAQFDKLASNVDVARRGATSATGTVTFFTTNPPIRDMGINEGSIVSSIGDLDQGIPSQNYSVQVTKVLEYANREQYYNITLNRYEISVDVTALNEGSSGNTDSFTIVSVSAGIDSDFQVENSNPITYGQDRESNRDLSTRVELAMFADTGTEGGYAKTAAGVNGVHYVRVEKAKDPLMIRDYDPIRNKHVGGKVDVYIRGEKMKQVSDQIAFSFESIVSNQGAQSGETFLILNAKSFQFKSQNPRVSAHTPIFEVTRVYNATKAKAYDITNYQIIGEGDSIDLDETLPENVIIGLASVDVIQVDYKFRSSDTYILNHQPVQDIVSIVGQLSGELTTDNYELVKLEDPLENGMSTIASDSVRIKFANNLPLTGFQTISNEAHILILDKEEPLNFLGADPESIVVQNNTTTFIRNVDYRIIPGTDITATSITMIETGSILNGEEVFISYIAIENFTITYTTNDLLNTVQLKIDEMKHACADAIAKQAIQNKIDFAFTVIPKTGVSNLAALTSKISTAISNYITQKGVGISITQSDINLIIRSIPDVDYVVVPFARMVKADGSFIVRDTIGRTQFELYNEDVVKSYITVASVLTFSTINNGGPENLFRAVFEDKQALVLQSDPVDVSGGYGRAYIQADGRLIISTKDGYLPDTKNYDVSYYVYGERGSKDITVASTESLIIGNITIKYDTPRTQQRVL